jgi:hypothetical protein
MQIFISWSGEQSRQLAEALRSWLPKVVQSVRPWMSKEDINAGSRWSAEISRQLESCQVGILCITPDNKNAPWLLFEAGALAKTIKNTFVCPLLLNVTAEQLPSPLGQFQASICDRDGLFRVLNSINLATDKDVIPTGDLEEIFSVWWPKLENQLNEILSIQTVIPPKRSIEDLLSEILENTREQLRREELRIERSKMIDQEIGEILPTMREGLTVDSPKISQILAKLSEMNPLISQLDLTSSLPRIDSSKLQQMFNSIENVQSFDRRFTSELLQNRRSESEPNE